MALTYEAPPEHGPLRQGEILGPIWEHRARYPPRALPRAQAVAVSSAWHALAVVLSPDCDLTWDYEVRFESFMHESGSEQLATEDHALAVGHVLLCDLQGKDDIRPRFIGERSIWQRIGSNQDQRYHHLPAAQVGEEPGLYLHDLYLDFKKAVSLPVGELYNGLLGGDITRVALLPGYHVHDLIHRFYGFLSRVALP